MGFIAGASRQSGSADLYAGSGLIRERLQASASPTALCSVTRESRFVGSTAASQNTSRANSGASGESSRARVRERSSCRRGRHRLQCILIRRGCRQPSTQPLCRAQRQRPHRSGSVGSLQDRETPRCESRRASRARSRDSRNDARAPPPPRTRSSHDRTGTHSTRRSADHVELCIIDCRTPAICARIRSNPMCDICWSADRLSPAPRRMDRSP